MSEPLSAASSIPVPVQAIESMTPIETSAGSAHGDVPEVLVTAQASSFNWRMVLAGGACVMAITALIALPGSSRVEAPTLAAAADDSTAGRVRTAPATLRTQENVLVTPIEEQVIVRPTATARLTGTVSSAVASSQPVESPVGAPAPAAPAHTDETTINEPVAAAPIVARVAPKAEPVEETAATMPTVTVTGCLEKRNDTFRLTDTDGDAPKSRSWKSGFLAKRAAAVELVDAASNLWLAAQVGQRISATGTLDDRELHVQSVRRATGACQ